MGGGGEPGIRQLADRERRAGACAGEARPFAAGGFRFRAGRGRGKLSAVMKADAVRPPVRVLIVKLSSLGDLFHALPAVHNLKTGLGARVDWVTQPEYVELVRCFTDVERVFAFPRRGWPRGLRPFLAELRRESYDYVIDLQGLLKSALVAFLARGRRRIGPSYRREGAGWFYTSAAAPRDRRRHAVEQALDVVGHLRLEPVGVKFPVKFPERRLTEPRPRVALLPLSRWASKNWPLPSFVEVGQRLRQRRGASMFILGGPADKDCGVELQRALGGGAVNLAGKLSLVETGALLKQMDLVIANDSGPIHMAAAVGTPVLAIFGPTDPRRTGPYGPRHRVLTASLPCQPCFRRNCRRLGLPCLANVRPEEVLAAAEQMLEAGTAPG